MDSVKKGNKFSGLVFAASTLIIWGITFVCTKYLSRVFSSLEILIIRFVMGFAGLWVMCPRRLTAEERTFMPYFAAAGFTGVAFYQLMENIAVTYTYAANVSIIVSASPMITAILSQLIFKERHLTLSFVTGLVLAAVGIVFVSMNSGSEIHLSPKGDFLALLSAISWGFYSIIISKLNSKGCNSIPVTRTIFLCALLIMIFVILIGKVTGLQCLEVKSLSAENLNRFKNPFAWLNLAFLGFGASAYCFFAWSRACSVFGTVKTTACLYLLPLITVVASFLFLGERLSIIGIAGMTLTITGLYISERK